MSAFDFPCASCGAKPGEPCITIRRQFGMVGSYRGQGVPAAHVHQPRLRLLVESRRGSSQEADQA